MILSFVAAAAALSAAPVPDDLRADRDQAYEHTLRGEFDAARSLYRSLLDQGADTADVWFNLGTVQIESGDPVAGVVSYLAGLRRSPSHADLRANLSAVQAWLEVGVERAPSWLDGARWVDGVPLWVWWSLLVLGNLGLATGALRRHAGLAAAGLIVAGAGAGAMALLHHAAHRPWAVVAETVPLRPGPAERYASTSEVRRGLDVRPERGRDADQGREAGWQKVTCPDGRTGYVPATALIDVPSFDPFRLSKVFGTPNG